MLGLIRQWVERGVITEEQAGIMQRDLEENKKERTSNNLIVALSTMGAVVLGLGVILFVGSNWQELSKITKVLILLVGTYGALWGGYYMAYVLKTFEKVGNALILLAGLLFCATIFLIAQIYNVNAHSHVLILLCLVGIVPLTYWLKSKAFAVLSMFGVYIWLGFVAYRSFAFDDVEEAFILLPVLLLVASILIFYLGGFHYWYGQFQKIGRIYRLAAIRIGLLVLLVLTFQGISGAVDWGTVGRLGEVREVLGQFTINTIVVAVLTMILGGAYLSLNPTKSETVGWEGGLTLFLSLLSVIYLLVPRSTDLFTWLFNLLFVAIALAVLVIGYKREDMSLVNVGIGFASLYIMVRYVDWFWDLLERSLFFIVGGAILVFGGFMLERERRRLKKQFTVDQGGSYVEA